ncbi:MAG TPA: aminotransferase class IV, partial [Anaerolineales bacterium]|nr:aminotransferase class IV [Anaerolineales bacterium]
MSRVDVWHITQTGTVSVNLPDLTSLDAVTRQLPEGYYSTFRTYAECTRVLGLRSHLQRLFEPVAAPDVDAATLRRELREVLKRYRPGEARVRALMTRQGNVYLALEPLQLLPHEIYAKGIRVETIELQRENPRLKSTTFISRSDAERKRMAEKGVFEALLVKEGMILEGMTSNFFYVQTSRAEREKLLCTAADDILLGVTRDRVIEIARGRGLEVRYEPLHR